MKAFTKNLNNASNSIKDIFTFEDNINIPHLKTENDILVKVHSASLNQVDYIYTITNEKIIARKPIISNFNEVCGLPVCFITAYVTIIYNFGTDVKNKKF